MPKRIDLTGQRFGRLLVLGYAGCTDEARWNVRCDCGVLKTVGGKSMREGGTVSCGCYHRERTGLIGRTRNVRHHGAHRGRFESEYIVWSGMLTRCNCPTQPSYPRYGGRGISVCERWSGRDGFAHFRVDMGLRPSPRHSLDRIDNDGNYESGNCRWATASEQAMNRRTAHIIEANGVRRHIGEWANELGVSVTTIYGRLRRGWSPALAVTTPPAIWGGRIRKLRREGRYDGQHDNVRWGHR